MVYGLDTEVEQEVGVTNHVWSVAFGLPLADTALVVVSVKATNPQLATLTLTRIHLLRSFDNMHFVRCRFTETASSNKSIYYTLNPLNEQHTPQKPHTKMWAQL